MDAVTTFILPGLGDSGPEHWQSHWERQDATCRRLLQADWDTPRCEDWVAALDAAMAIETNLVVFVAHSSSCALVAHWASGATRDDLSRVRGALLVAPSDPDGPNYPPGPTGFGPVRAAGPTSRGVRVTTIGWQSTAQASVEVVPHAGGDHASESLGALIALLPRRRPAPATGHRRRHRRRER